MFFLGSRRESSSDRLQIVGIQASVGAVESRNAK